MAKGRSIRLKEMQADRNDSVVVPEWYMKNTDGSLDPGPFLVRTDRHGFLITGNGDRSHLPKLTFLGGSFVESLYSFEPERFVSGVERRLEDLGLNYNCRNGGYSGASSLQLANVILNKIYPLGGSSQTLVLFGPQTDVHIYGAPATYWSDTERYAPVLPPIEPELTNMVRGYEATRRILDISIHSAKVLGMNIILATSPYRSAPTGGDAWLVQHLGAGSATVLARREMYTESVRQAATVSGVPFIDAAAAFANRPELFYDEMHLNRMGQDIFADWLSMEIASLEK